MSGTSQTAADADISTAVYLAQLIRDQARDWRVHEDQPGLWVFTEPGRNPHRSVTVDGRARPDVSGLTVTANTHGITTTVQYPPQVEQWRLRALVHGLEDMAALPPKEYRR